MDTLISFVVFLHGKWSKNWLYLISMQHIRFYKLTKTQQDKVFLRHGVKTGTRFGRKAVIANGIAWTAWVRCDNVIYWAA